VLATKTGSSFLDDWLSKRQQLAKTNPPATTPKPATTAAVADVPLQGEAPLEETPQDTKSVTADDSPTDESANSEKLHLRGDENNAHSEISVKLH